MEIIKKRLQANKIDLENALDRADTAEHQLREQAARAERAECEVAALARRITLLEQELARSEERLKVACEKLEAATQVADEGERARKMLEHRAAIDEERVEALEIALRETRFLADNADLKFEEAVRKLDLVGAELERVEDRATKAEAKQAEQESELEVVGNNLRSFELNEERALQELQSYEKALRDAQERVRESESRAESAERTVQKLHKDIDRLEEALVDERQKYKHISDELDQTFPELTACQ